MTSCNDIEALLVDELDGELDETNRAELERHLETCEACRETARSYRAICEAYRATPEEDVPSAVAERILAEAARPVPKPTPRRLALSLVLAAAALVALWLGRELVRSAPSPVPDPVVELIREADELRNAGKLERAVAVYERARSLDAEDAREALLLHRLGEAHHRLGEEAEAAESLDRLTRDFPDYEGRRDAQLLRGEVLVAQGELDRAMQLYRSVAAEYPAMTEEVRGRLQDLELATIEQGYDNGDLTELGYGGD